MALLWVHPQELLTPLDVPKLVIGRSDGVDLLLSGDRVSRRHASIEVLGRNLILRDEGSRNGTRCNGRLVKEVPLNENDVVRVGDWVGIVMSLPTDRIGRSPLFAEPLPGVLAGPRTQQLWHQVRTVAASNLPVVVEGATGTGKEVIGQAIHSLSGRPGDIIAVNCAALPDTLIEAQLFGHAKGAFTGAHQASSGYFGAAHRGTLFLDELLELPLAQQAKLLRAVEEGCVTPVGSTQPRQVDVRIVAATQKPLWRLVEEGRFRADLQARLSGMTLKLPPLRQRREEIPRLFARMLGDSALANCRHRASFVEALCMHNWTMNVRELVQTAHRATVLLGDITELSGNHFRSLLGTDSPSSSIAPSQPPASQDLSAQSGEYLDTQASEYPCIMPRNEAEQREQQVLGRRRYAWLQRNRPNLDALLNSLSRNSGNVSLSARELGISRQRAHRLLEVHAQLQGPGTAGN